MKTGWLNHEPLSLPSPRKAGRGGPESFRERGVREKVSCSPRETGGERGFTLLECIAYGALLVVVSGLALGLFYQCWDDSKALRRDADDIVRALRTGEQWRADLRVATGPVQLTAAQDSEQLRIPAAGGEVVYGVSDGKLWRKSSADSVNKVWLPNVASSRMQSETRGHVAAWRWELELNTVKKSARVRPLFTFEAVAGGANPG